ncbi:MAG: ABC transporter substrate-binding protein [Actinobacteria bacterium]|nr:ABC transporter substrate-binding protein [Actinomycetota bacterium]
MKFPGRSLILGIVLLLAAAALTSVSAVPTYRSKAKTFFETLTEGGGAVTTTAAGPLSSGGQGGPIGGSKPGQACAPGRNGGSTDTGVTANAIRLGATVVRSGIGSAFLGGAPTSMQAMATKINRQGGVCGRLLDLKMIDDGWDATRGVTALRSLTDQGVFALAVSPSSEGVNALVTAGDLAKKGVPLIGADGLVKSEYKDPWVWPVAASTVSTMHIIVQEMIKRGAKTFGIVFENDYKFGVEGADAYYHAVKNAGFDIPGYDPSHSTCRKTFCGIISGQPSYSSEVQEFNSSCGTPNPGSGFNPQTQPAGGSFPSCDVVALLLEPKTALTWLTKNGGAAPHGGGRTMGPQPLFSADFAKQCDKSCAGMEVWTSYNPPLPPYVNSPAIADYSQTVKTLDPSLDVANSFTEGAYLGMNVLIEALKRVGPNLTRGALRQALDSGSYDFGIGPPLQWRPGNHLGNGAMQSYSLQYQGNTFIAFTLQSHFVTDSLLGKDL